ncbi:hypothetical protein C7999DRAFT_12921 [Corynascus novoguineensis]|uniref:Uncharacterized protein n=1 Tax=Corynascus novoguineensis TaxID=1126955 RepID=A0AAN7CVR7_9PEZI|nr:hypothetical protein C7999DRAFT_12921 [Corynascus novoguineensis]
MALQQSNPQPPLDRYEPNDHIEPSRPSHSEPTFNSSTLPYRPHPENSETTDPSHRHHSGNELPTTGSYPPPPSAPGPAPLNTSSSTSYNNYHNNTANSAQPLAYVSPRPISGPGPEYSKSELPRVHPSHAAAPTTYPPPNSYGHASTNLPPTQPPAANVVYNLTNGTTTSTDIRAGRASVESALRELLAARRQRVMVHRVDGTSGKPNLAAEVEERVRAQTGLVLSGLRGLQERVDAVVARAHGERWRRWGIGGVIASIIPLVKRLFRRRRDGSDDDDESSNRTEYAFKKSKSLVSRILAAAHRPGLGTVAFFVFAVLYIFQNEVSLRVSRTVSKRLKRLVTKIEDGREELTENDVKVLQGWRWRVLAWSE